METIESDKTKNTDINKYMKKFKKKNPDYYKIYYQKNKDKFNKIAINKRTKWYGIEIFGTTYYFNNKKDINIKCLDKNDIKKKNFVFIQSTD